MPKDRFPKQALLAKVSEKRQGGRPKSRRTDCINDLLMESLGASSKQSDGCDGRPWSAAA